MVSQYLSFSSWSMFQGLKSNEIICNRHIQVAMSCFSTFWSDNIHHVWHLTSPFHWSLEGSLGIQPIGWPQPTWSKHGGRGKVLGPPKCCKKKHGCLSWIIWILHLRRFEFDLRKCQVLFTFVQCPKSLRIGTLTLSLYRTAKWWKQNITSEEHEHRYSVHYVGYSSYKYFVPL